MRTDVQLVALLERCFDEGTADLQPGTGLGPAVRRRYVADRRRRTALGLALPVAGAAVIGTVVASDGPAAPAHTAQGPGPSSALTRPVAYRLTEPADPTAFPCLDPSLGDPMTLIPDASMGFGFGPGGFGIGEGSCRIAVVGFVTAPPAGATPLGVPGRPGLLGTTDPARHLRTVYAPVSHRTRVPIADGVAVKCDDSCGDWTMLVLPISVTDAQLAQFLAVGS